MQSEMKQQIPRPERRRFAEDLSALGDTFPHKVLFAALLLVWLALFHFLGNSTLGYISTRSIFGWLQDIYAHSADDNFGMFIPLTVVALLWWKRDKLATTSKKIWWPALALFALGIALHVLGYTVQQARLSIIGFFLGLYALVGLLWGRSMLRATFFPFFLFAFMVPLTGEMEGLTLPLRQLATKITVTLSHLLGIDVQQEGTIIKDRAGHFSYNVEAACSGLRSLVTMLMLGCIFGFVAFRSRWKRGVLIASGVPLAVLGNVIRLLGIVIAANWKYDQMIRAQQPVPVAEHAAQTFGNFVHEQWVLQLVPYIPAFIGMMLLARWLREDAAPVKSETPSANPLSGHPAYGIALAALILTVGAAAFLATQHSRQKLGPPGVRLTNEPIYAVEGGASTNAPALVSSNRVYLPAHVLDYQSQSGNIPSITVATLPKDTTFGRRIYGRPNGTVVDCQVVLMGADRSSIHKPQICLKGSGFDTTSSELTTMRVVRPHAYDLPIMRLNLQRQKPDANGTMRTEACVFVYWFVADHELTARHSERMWWMARDMLKTGVLQRWAYVICFAPCAPGTEETTFEHLKEFIAASVPEFQLTSGTPVPVQSSEARLASP